MPSLHRIRVALALAAVVAAGCQDYNFNPVGQCLIQPGSRRVTLSDISSADVLFVVDDSGSMRGEQDKLAANFSAFIANLDAANDARAAAGLEPIDFHIAVTTTSIFWNFQTTQTCRSDCPGASSSLVCCTSGNTPALRPRACTPGGAACPSSPTATTCRNDCNQLKGAYYCCDSGGNFPTSAQEQVPCSRAGVQCGTFERHHSFPSGCTPGVAVNEWPFPRGDFVSWSGGSSANPRVLHFDKELYTTGVNRQGFTDTQLIDFFRGAGPVGGNIAVGTCGSGQEQALRAARLALEKAASRQQKDTYAREKDGGGNPVPTWNAATRTASSDADWLVAGSRSKLVLVFVGDEDDCSSPEDPSGGVVMLSEPPGNDACSRDAGTAAPLGQKQFAVSSFVDYVMGLGRPVGAAFVFPAAQESCSGDSCTAGTCCARDCPGTIDVCTNNATCGGQAAGHRLLAAAGEFEARGADVVVGSICDPRFAALLDQVAEIVKPPAGLTLPSRPAESDITVLRIVSPSGQTRKVCGRPLAPATYASLAAAQASGADWWFTQVPDVVTPTIPVPQPWNPVALSQFVYINPQGSCIANPGETYSADYIGRLPEGGCLSDAQCGAILGPGANGWTCYVPGPGGTCEPDGVGTPGTCLCGNRSKNCP